MVAAVSCPPQCRGPEVLVPWEDKDLQAGASLRWGDPAPVGREDLPCSPRATLLKARVPSPPTDRRDWEGPGQWGWQEGDRQGQ